MKLYLQKYIKNIKQRNEDQNKTTVRIAKKYQAKKKQSRSHKYYEITNTTCLFVRTNINAGQNSGCKRCRE